MSDHQHSPRPVSPFQHVAEVLAACKQIGFKNVRIASTTDGEQASPQSEIPEEGQREPAIQPPNGAEANQ